MKFYKILTAKGTAPYTGFDYGPYLPTTTKPGKWLPAVKGAMTICGNGYHVAMGKVGLGYWIDSDALLRRGYRVFLVEVGKRKISRNWLRPKNAFSRIRLVRELSSSQVLAVLNGR